MYTVRLHFATVPIAILSDYTWHHHMMQLALGFVHQRPHLLQQIQNRLVPTNTVVFIATVIVMRYYKMLVGQRHVRRGLMLLQTVKLVSMSPRVLFFTLSGKPLHLFSSLQLEVSSRDQSIIIVITHSW